MSKEKIVLLISDTITSKWL